MTAIFAGIFFFLSLLMAWSIGGPARTGGSIMDSVPAGTTTPAPGGTTAPAAPAAPTAPSAPNR
jgi:preprotein translocase subunit SecG